jgi:hypothetical protein
LTPDFEITWEDNEMELLMAENAKISGKTTLPLMSMGMSKASHVVKATEDAAALRVWKFVKPGRSQVTGTVEEGGMPESDNLITSVEFEKLKNPLDVPPADACLHATA